MDGGRMLFIMQSSSVELLKSLEGVECVMKEEGNFNLL